MLLVFHTYVWFLNRGVNANNGENRHIKGLELFCLDFWKLDTE